MSALSDEVGKLQMELTATERMRDTYRREVASEDPQLPVEANSELVKRTKALDDLLLRYTDEHPDVVSTRRILQRLQDEAREQMVTSALPREGKTFCAINLAMSMSFEIDTSVLLVDADVMRPEVMLRLGLAPERGLLDLLVDPTLALADVVLNTNIPKLSILPAGGLSNRSSELLASDAMDTLLLTLATSDPRRIVVFDAPPLLVTTEAKVLAARMGQVVMVVAASSTPRSALVDAFAIVEHCPHVMSVLNKAPAPSIPLGYGYI